MRECKLINFHIFSIMDTIPEDFWEKLFNDSDTYTTGYEGPTSFPSLDCHASYDTSEINLQATNFSQGFQTEIPHMNRVTTPIYTDQAHSQELLENQGFGVKDTETIKTKYGEIKAMYGQAFINVIMLMSVKLTGELQVLRSTFTASNILLTMAKTDRYNNSTPCSSNSLFRGDEIDTENPDRATQQSVGSTDTRNSVARKSTCIEPGWVLWFKQSEQECWRGVS